MGKHFQPFVVAQAMGNLPTNTALQHFKSPGNGLDGAFAAQGDWGTSAIYSPFKVTSIKGSYRMVGVKAWPCRARTLEHDDSHAAAVSKGR